MTIENQVREHVIQSVSKLVRALDTLVDYAGSSVLELADVSEDDIQSLRGIDDWRSPVENFVAGMCVEDLIDELDAYEDISVLETLTAAEMRERLLKVLEDLDAWQDFARSNRIWPDRREASSWYLVSDWLADQLEQRGEIVGEICDLTIWGRCTSGQAIWQDGVIQEIFREP